MYGHIYHNITRPAPQLLARFKDLWTATLSDAMGIGISAPVAPRLIMELTGSAVDDAAGMGGWYNIRAA